MTTNQSPLEHEEQSAFVDWLEVQGLLFTATAQSTYTTSFNQKRRNKAAGVRKGFPDMIVIIPPDKSIDGDGYLIGVEMKRIRGGVVSTEQRVWIDTMNSLGVNNIAAYVCKGAESAIKVVSHYLCKVDNSPF